MSNPCWVNEHAADVYSQGGEDGVIEAVLKRIPDPDRWCVEVGASDGSYLSNTRNLIEQGYSAVEIEADSERYRALEARYARRSDIVTIRARVGHTAGDGLDSLLLATPVPPDFDFLSIDVDGFDLQVWSALETYRPKIVCIEFNPTMPTELSITQSLDGGSVTGSSLLALVELGRRKGYELAAVLAVNAIFVRADYFPLLEITDNRPSTLRTDQSLVTYLYSGYDGTVHLSGHDGLPWHHVPFSARSVQVLPKWLRTYPSDYRAAQKVGLGLFLLVKDPKELARWLRDRRHRSRAGS